MDSLIRAAIVYAFLLLIFRIAGRRTLAEVTTFELVLSLIISETIQQALIDGDDSMTNAFLLVITLVGLNIIFSELKQRSHRMDLLIDGAPILVMKDGKLLHDRMNKERVDKEDILQAGRSQEGLSSLGQLEHVILERDGSLSVIPKKN
jgi:uncharacterized membrane protein YcaP (DUF421 family)